MAGETITKADLARELKLTPSRITQFVKSGLPVLSDGKLDRTIVLKWLATYRTSGRDRTKGPCLAADLLKTEAAQPPESVRMPPTVTAAYNCAGRWDLADVARVETAEVVLQFVDDAAAEAALEAGLPIPLAFAVTSIMRQKMITAIEDALGFLHVPGVFDPAWSGLTFNPSFAADWPALASRLGQPFDKDACRAAEQSLPFWADRSVFRDADGAAA